MITLDEAIIHCMETYVKKKDTTECLCAAEHLQLAEWLTELRMLKSDKPKITNIIDIKDRFKNKDDYRMNIKG